MPPSTPAAGPGLPSRTAPSGAGAEEYLWLARRVRDGAVGAVQAILAHGLPNLVFHGCHWYDIALMLVGDPEPEWVGGRVDEGGAQEPDEGRRLDPPGHAWVGLDNGATLALLPEGGGRAFTILGNGGRLEIVNDARQAYLWEARSGYPGREPGGGTGQSGGATAHRAVAARTGASCATWCTRYATPPRRLGATCRRSGGLRRSASRSTSQAPRAVPPSVSPWPTVPGASIPGRGATTDFFLRLRPAADPRGRDTIAADHGPPGGSGGPRHGAGRAESGGFAQRRSWRQWTAMPCARPSCVTLPGAAPRRLERDRLGRGRRRRAEGAAARRRRRRGADRHRCAAARRLRYRGAVRTGLGVERRYRGGRAGASGAPTCATPARITGPETWCWKPDAASARPTCCCWPTWDAPWWKWCAARGWW